VITFDLRCGGGHVFEAWFRDRRSFLDQKERGLVECPVCGARDVEMSFSPVAVRTTGRSEAPPAGDSLAHRVALFLKRNFEDVGEGFAEEARRIHYGETEPRGIRGVTTPGQEEELREEGIGFLKIPLPRLDG
jgi:hypothetical protein